MDNLNNNAQLEMNFDLRGNRFREQLKNGKFVLLIESNSPERDADFNHACEKLRALEEAVFDSSNRLFGGLALCSGLTSVSHYQNVDFASALDNGRRDHHVVYLDGRDQTLKDINDAAKLCKLNAFQNVVAVSGNAAAGDTAKECAKHDFCGSCSTITALDSLRRFDDFEFNIGGVVNPYKYTAADIFLQYFKLMKKISLGADFVVAQMGWDMRKIQELLWYLNMRNRPYSVLARMMFLSAQTPEKIIRGDYAGINISADFRRILENELKYSHSQFEAAQWRRIQLQAAGCYLMGCSGIQLCGIDSPDKVRIAFMRIAEALDEFNSFEDWKNEYVQYMGRAEMAPYPYDFYLFKNLFSKQAPEKEDLIMNSARIPDPTSFEKLKFRIKRYLFKDSHIKSPDDKFFLKKLLVSCKSCLHCHLAQTQFVCTENCPKHLADGPCGGTKVNGQCEVNSGLCVHAGRFQVAAWRNSLDDLENISVNDR